MGTAAPRTKDSWTPKRNSAQGYLVSRLTVKTGPPVARQ